MDNGQLKTDNGNRFGRRIASHCCLMFACRGEHLCRSSMRVRLANRELSGANGS
jgi:hypothetical protein